MASSWTPYVENLLSSNAVKEAAFFGTDGKLWASSNGWTVTTEDALRVISALAQPDIAAKEGVKIGGKKYYILRADYSSLDGRLGQSGISVRRTRGAIILAYYDSSQHPGPCNLTVEKVALFLTAQGY